MEVTTLENSGTNAGQANNLDYSKNELEILQEQIEGTPFAIKWVKDKGWSFGVGEYKLSKDYETKEEMLDKLNLKEIKKEDEQSEYEMKRKTGMDWFLTANVISIYVEMYEQAKKYREGR